MRPRLIDLLEGLTGTTLAGWLVPHPAVVYTVAMIAVLVVFVRRCGRVGLSREIALTGAMWAMAAGLVGTRLFYLLGHLDLLTANPAMVFDLQGGTVSWGAYLGGGGAFLVYLTLRARGELGRFADALASSLALGPAIGRWACLLNGDDFGAPSGLPWAVRYPAGSYPYVEHLRQGWIEPGAELSATVHPFQLYLSLNALAVFALFSLLWKRGRLRPGRLFLLYWLVYPGSRFFWEFLRGGVAHDLLGVLDSSQVISLILVAASGLGLLLTRRAGATRPWASGPVG